MLNLRRTDTSHSSTRTFLVINTHSVLRNSFNDLRVTIVTKININNSNHAILISTGGGINVQLIEQTEVVYI